MSALRVGVWGVGAWGEKHARVYATLPGVTLAGVFDRHVERASAAAAKHGGVAFESPEALLAACDAVSVAVPTVAHREAVERAVAAGCHVLVEKPMAVTVEEADQMIAAARRAGVILQVGQVERFNPAFLAARPHVRRPMFIEAHRLAVFQPRSLDVDVVFDLMIHDLDLVLWMVDSPATDVRAVGLPVLSDRVDIANARVEFETGAVANLTASRVSTEKVRKFRYFQPSEYVSIDFSRRDAIALSVDRNGPAPKIGYRRLEPPGAVPPDGVAADPLRAELAAFIDSVRTRRPPLVGGQEGRAALALAERVMNCIEEHAAQLHVPLGRSSGRSGEL